MLKILQARLQQYVNWELLDAQAGFRKGRGTRDQTANIRWITEKAREFQKNIYLCFIDYAKAFNCVDDNRLWKILQEVGLPDHLTCFLRKLYAGQEAAVRTGHGKMHWFVTGKEVHRGWILLPTYLNAVQSVYVSPSAVSNSLRPHALRPTKLECIMQNAKVDEAQAGIKTAGEIATSDMQMIPL